MFLKIEPFRLLNSLLCVKCHRLARPSEFRGCKDVSREVSRETVRVRYRLDCYQCQGSCHGDW